MHSSHLLFVNTAYLFLLGFRGGTSVVEYYYPHIPSLLLTRVARIKTIVFPTSDWCDTDRHECRICATYVSFVADHPPAIGFCLSAPGETIDGKEFDSSFKRGKPATFAPKQVQSVQSSIPDGAPEELVLPLLNIFVGRAIEM